MTLKAAYNNMYFIYIALFSASLYAFVVIFTSFDLQAICLTVKGHGGARR